MPLKKNGRGRVSEEKKEGDEAESADSADNEQFSEARDLSGLLDDALEVKNEPIDLNQFSDETFGSDLI